MRRTKMLGVSLAAVAALGGPLGAAPAHAEVCDIYPCELARDTAAFARQEADHVLVFVGERYHEVGEIVIDVACILFPTQPECQ